MPIMPLDGQRFDEEPYALDRTLCGFNALIDYLNLDMKKANESTSAEVARMIRELTNEELDPGIGIGEQSKQLQQLIDSCVTGPEEQKRVIELADEKFEKLRVHGEWS
ncbi:hypothetical protein [Prolixibacter sp. NT017]|uniref:hypothetical protein n=1 Tax=Prolixibacter sp. NT017 TaxID=2652390 RepID=UPI0012711228|nr:hypothetical protein [Prolixibacter sp. NT017]GET24478.1 hypothetical protein NT017_08070 [Prolixibacter sp. NT017]